MNNRKKEYILTCKCGNKYSVNITEYIFGKGDYRKFCSRKCIRPKKIKEVKLGRGKHKRPRKTPVYNKCQYCQFEYEAKNIKQRFCSVNCAHKNLTEIQIKNNHHQKMGLKSVTSQNKRSKNEIAFAELCEKNFKKVLFNEPIFNGWDADIIIEDFKIAILWNGIWHYEKITKKHSLIQVQNRDKIKLFEINSCKYIAYVIKDIGKFDMDKVELEWKAFNTWLNFTNHVSTL